MDVAAVPEELAGPVFVVLFVVGFLMAAGASMLGVSGGWQNRAAARKVYDELQAMPPAVSEPALLRALVRRPGNREIVFLAVRLGRPAPDRLLQALNATQELEIALHFLNTVVPDLIAPAQDWCRLRDRVQRALRRPEPRLGPV